MKTLLTCATWLALDVAVGVAAPPPPVDHLAWAKDNIVFSQRESPYPGPYNEDQFPYFSEMLRALGPDDPCRVVSNLKSAQIGGTVVANIFTLGTLQMDPCDFLYTHPTEDNAGRWSKLKLRPMLKNTASLAALFPETSRDGGSSILFKERVDGKGSIQISGANSPASLSMVTMRCQVQDDLSKWEINSAGDPESQADSRSEAHEYAKIFKVGTPTIEPGCRITSNFKQGTQERFHVPCPQCDHYQSLEWANMRDSIDPDNPDAAHFTCVSCGMPIEEHHRAAIVRRGHWVAANEKARREHRSFYMWSAYSPLQSWPRIARRWLRAQGNPAAEQVFLNDVVGQAYKADGEAVPWETLRDRAAETGHKRGVIPPGALLLTLGVDVQDGWLAWQLVGWGREYQRFVIDAGKIEPQNLDVPADNAHISEDATRRVLDRLVNRTWPNTFGRQIGVDFTAIDGNAFTEDVWGWARRHPRSKVIMVRGANSELAPMIKQVANETNEKTGKVRRYAKRFYTFNGSVLKLAFYRNLRKDDPVVPGYVHFCRDLGDEYFQEATSERRKGETQKNGFVKYKWVKDPGQRNEMLDTMIQAEVAAIKFGVRLFGDSDWARYAIEREVPPAETQTDLEDFMLTSQPTEVAKADDEPGFGRING